MTYPLPPDRLDDLDHAIQRLVDLQAEEDAIDDMLLDEAEQEDQ